MTIRKNKRRLSYKKKADFGNSLNIWGSHFMIPVIMVLSFCKEMHQSNFHNCADVQKECKILKCTEMMNFKLVKTETNNILKSMVTNSRCMIEAIVAQ